MHHAHQGIWGGAMDCGDDESRVGGAPLITPRMSHARAQIKEFELNRDHVVEIRWQRICRHLGASGGGCNW